MRGQANVKELLGDLEIARLCGRPSQTFEERRREDARRIALIERYQMCK